MKMSAIETTALPPGSTVEHFTITDCIGFDHQGCVYRAERVDTGVPATVFEFLPAGLAIRGPTGIEALHDQAEEFARAKSLYGRRLRAAALIGHPALPVLHDIWEGNGTVYAAGPWTPGRSLLSELATRPAGVDNRTLETWLRSICDALSALHRHDIVHGNLSVGVIRVLDTGELMLPPVGVGIYGEDVPPWIAPEQHPLNPKPTPLGPWTDIYQLSAIAFQVMTGQTPPSVAKRWQGEAPFGPLGDVAGRYPEGVLLATRHGLSMHVTARPQSAELWLREAGFPDRREHSRYELAMEAPVDGETEAAPDTARAARTAPGPQARLAEAAPGAGDAGWPTSAARARGSPMPATMTGHQPLPDAIEARLDGLEHTPPRSPSMPAWVWVSAVAAVVALIAIVLMN